jgi:molecular chaperone GrpE
MDKEPENLENTESEVSPEGKSEVQELDQIKDQLLRTMAELDNTQKRAIKERDDAKKYAISNFAKDLLVIRDTLDRALESVPEEDRKKEGLLKTIFDGVSLTRDELLKVFTHYHIVAINPAGEKFDHNYHQAVLEVESPNHAKGMVVAVLQTGYKIQDRLLRPAMVSVAK